MDYAIELLLKIMETEIEEVVSGTVTVLTSKELNYVGKR